MKAIIICCFMFLLTAAEVFSQYGLETVYTDNLTGIRQFNSVKINNDNDKKIFFQLNENGSLFTGGEYFKLNKLNNSVSYSYDGLLNPPNFEFCDDQVMMQLVEFFIVSPLREQILIFNNKINCDTVFADKTFFSLNGISKQEIPVSNCAGFDISQNDSIFYIAGTSDLIYYYIYKSTNRGSNWFSTDTLSGLRRIFRGGFLKHNPIDQNILYVTGNSNLLISTNAGYDFMNTNAPSFDKIYFNQNKVYGIISNKLYSSSDNGLNWEMIFTNLTFDFTCLEFSVENDQIIYAGTDAGLFRSTDIGLSFSLYNNAFPFSKKILGLSKDPFSGSPLYACTRKGIYKVLNGHYEPIDFISPFKIGNFFEYLYNNFNEQYYYNVRVTSNTQIINGIQYFELQTNNNSSYTYEFIDSISLKWYKYSPGCPDNNELVINLLEDTSYVFRGCSYRRKVTRHGVTNTMLGDTTHLRYSAYYPYPFPLDANEWSYSEKFGFFRSSGHGFVIDLTGAIIDGVTYGQIHTGVNNISNEIPDKFELYQNYPNPFNPVTVIRYSLIENGFVTLKLYDALGNEVATLVNENQSSGTYNYQLSTVNYQLSSGVYFYKLSAAGGSEDFTETKRMILLK